MDSVNNSERSNAGAPAVRCTNRPGASILALACIGFCLSLLFQYLPFKNLMVDGIYQWHVKQPEFVQGGIELLVVFVLFSITAFAVQGRLGTGVVVALSALYLRRHAVLEPVLVALLYFEIILSFGRWVLCAVDRTDGQAPVLNDYLKAFVAGLACWSALAIALSALGYGRFNHLRLMTACVGLLSLTRGVPPFLTVHLWRAALTFSKREKAVAAALLTLFLALFAKASVAFDTDSLSYGLRPEFVLIGEHSFFDNLGLLNAIYYYPKLLELFLVPISNLGDYRFAIAGNIFFLFLLAVVVYRFFRSFAASRFAALFAVLVICTVPVVANMAATVKTDTFSTLLVVMTAYALWMSIQSRNAKPLLWGLATSILSFGGKPTSFAYIPMLFFGFAVSLVATNRTAVRDLLHDLRSRHTLLSAEVLLVIISLAVLAGITARTVLLTGYPFYNISESLNGLWKALGFTLHYPFSVGVPISGVGDPLLGEIAVMPVLKTGYELFFNPSNMIHILPIWFGNISLFLCIVVLVLVVLQRTGRREFWSLLIMNSAVILTGLVFVLFFPFGSRGGDANYYLPPIVLAMIVLFHPVLKQYRYRPLVFASLVPFIVFQSALMLVSHFSWHHGTSAFDWQLTKPFISTAADNKQILDKAGVKEVAEYIEQRPRAARAVGLGEAQAMYRLPCRYEHFDRIGGFNKKKEVVHREELLRQYLLWAKIDYLVLPKVPHGGYVVSLFDELEHHPLVHKVEAERYYLLDMTRVREDAADIFTRQRTEESRKGNYQYLVRYLGLYQNPGRPNAGQYVLGPIRTGSDEKAKVRASKTRPPIYVRNGTTTIFPLAAGNAKKSKLIAYVEYGPGPYGDRDGVQLRIEMVKGVDKIVLSDVFVHAKDGTKTLEYPLADVAGNDTRVELTVNSRSVNVLDHEWPVWIELALL